MKVGYARVSTDDQRPALQTDALHKAGCKTMFTDKGASSAAIKRPQLERCLKALEVRRCAHGLEARQARTVAGESVGTCRRASITRDRLRVAV